MSRAQVEVRPSRWVGLGALVLCGLLIGLDSTILFTAVPTLSARLGASISQLQWISAAYTLAWAGLLLPSGVLGDRLGRRRVLLFGLLLFGVASVLASQTTSPNSLIAMRSLMGLGAAVILPLSLAVLPTMFSESERPRAVSLTAVGTFLGLPLGPLVAGWLLTHYAWGTIFLINAPIVALAVLGVGFLVPESRGHDAPRIDLLGSTTVVAGIVGVVYGIIQAPTDGLPDTRVLIGLVGGSVMLVIFIAWELRVKSPLVDLRLFRNARFTWPTITFVVLGFVLSGVLFIVTPYLQVVQGTDAQGTGLRLLPMIAGVMVGGLAGDPIAGRIGTGRTIAAGLGVASGGLFLLLRIDASTGYGLVAAGLAVLGLGIGLALPTALDAILDSLPAASLGAGNGLTRTLQQVAASLGVAVLGSILSTAYKSKLNGHLLGVPTQLTSVAEANLTAAAHVAHLLPTPLRAQLLASAYDAYTQGMRDVVLLCAVILVLAALLVLKFLRSPNPANE